MDIEKMRKWLEITNESRQSDFWSSVLKHKTADEFLRDKDYQTKPIYDLYQNEYYNFVIIEIPGVNERDVTLQLISKSQLLVKGTTSSIFPLETELKRERIYGFFERVIDLPEKTDERLMNIKFFNGLLLISYPRWME